MKLAYRPGQSFFHRLDPITKFGWTLLVTLWLMTLRGFSTTLVVSLGLMVVCLLGAQIPIGHYLKTLRIFLWAGVFLILYQGIFRPGSGIEVGPVHLSYSGLELGTAITFRSFGLAASSLAFSRTTRPRDVHLSLIKLGMPYRLAYVGYLALRFVPLLERDFQSLSDAQKLRGIKRGPQSMQRSFIALLATEARKTEETAIALETRAFGLYKDQTKLDDVQISCSGLGLIAITSGIISLSLMI